MITTRQQSETEKAMRAFAGDDPVEQARIDLIVSEADRSARAIDQARDEDIRRAAEGRRVLG